MQQKSKQSKLPMFKKKYGKKALKLPPLCAFDFETEGLGGRFIVGAFVPEDDERVLFYTLEDCFKYIVDHPVYRYLAHNASGYEFAYLYPLIHELFDNNPNVTIETTLQGTS